MATRIRNEWLNQMKINLNHLSDFAKLYDEGKIDYAIEMSSKLRTLFDERKPETDNKSNKCVFKNPKSLLINFCNTYTEKIPELLNDVYFAYETDSKIRHYDSCNLCAYKFKCVDSKSQEQLNPIPKCNDKTVTTDRNKKRSYDDWWEKVIVIKFADTNQTTLFRKDVVKLVCDQDGGAHVDRHLNSNLTYLMRNMGKPIEFIHNGTTYTAKLDELLYAAIRQITFETLETLNPFLKKLQVFPKWIFAFN